MEVESSFFIYLKLIPIVRFIKTIVYLMPSRLDNSKYYVNSFTCMRSKPSDI